MNSKLNENNNNLASLDKEHFALGHKAFRADWED